VKIEKTMWVKRFVSSLLMSAGLLILTGCERGVSPDNQWEFAYQGAYSANLSRDGQLLVVGSIHHGGSLWRFTSHERLFDWNHKANELSNVLSSAFSPDGEHVVTADHRTLVIWNSKTGAAGWFWNAPGNINDMAVTGNGQFALLGMDDYTAAFFDIKNGGVKHTLNHQGSVDSVAMSDDGQIAITGSDDQSAKIWNLQTGKKTQALIHQKQVSTVAISHDGSIVFTAELRGRAALWNTQAGEMMTELIGNHGNIISAKFSANADELITGSSTGYVQIWNVQTGKEVAVGFATPKNRWVANNVSVLDVSFGKQEKFYAIGSNGLGYEFTR
jgi:WD40 repeat protein